RMRAARRGGRGRERRGIRANSGPMTRAAALGSGGPRPYHPNPHTPRRTGGAMRIDVKGRNFAVDDELRERVEKRFTRIARQVSEMARLELELSEERNPSIRESSVAEATLYLKGVTLRARDTSDNMAHAIHLVADELTRQVKRHRDKRRGHRTAAKVEPPPATSPY